MPVRTYSPPNGMSQIRYIGNTPYMRDVLPSRPGKDEWGLDTVERLVRGGSPDEWEAYGTALDQGDAHPTAPGFFLQSWRPYDDNIFPGWFLFYKGLRGGLSPDPLPQSSVSEGVGTITAADLSISYQGRTIVAAEKQIKFTSKSTTRRYITNSLPTTTRYDSVDGPANIEILDSRIMATYDDGSVQQFAGSAPAGLASALASTPYIFNPGPSYVKVFGTPYYEVEETCQVRYGQ